MEIVIIIGTISFGACLAGTLALLVMGSDTPKGIRIITALSLAPVIVCFAILAAFAKSSVECKVKYRKVNVELYEKVE